MGNDEECSVSSERAREEENGVRDANARFGVLLGRVRLEDGDVVAWDDPTLIERVRSTEKREGKCGGGRSQLAGEGRKGKEGGKQGERNEGAH